LEKAWTVLAPDGVCLVLAPNLGSLAVRCLGAKYRYIMPDHLNYFTVSTLRRLGQSVGGLEVVEMTQTHFNPIVIWQDWRGQGGPVAEDERARLLRRTTALKQNPILGPVKLLYAGLERLLVRLGWADNLVMVLRRRLA
jgi:hypothetical protein